MTAKTLRRKVWKGVFCRAQGPVPSIGYGTELREDDTEVVPPECVQYKALCFFASLRSKK